jgi:hypothetical protein
MAESFFKREIIKKKTADQFNDKNFRRQNVIFAKKVNKFKKEFSADIFILVRRKGKLLIYTSRDSLNDF